MFFSKANKKEVLQNIESLQAEVIRLWRNGAEYIRDSHYVDCETCKCLIRKENTFKGENVIKQKQVFSHYEHYDYVSPHNNKPVYKTEDYIHTPYYCLKCKPKEISGVIQERTSNTGIPSNLLNEVLIKDKGTIELYPDKKGNYSYNFTESGIYTIKLKLNEK